MVRSYSTFFNMHIRNDCHILWLLDCHVFRLYEYQTFRLYDYHVLKLYVIYISSNTCVLCASVSVHCYAAHVSVRIHVTIILRMCLSFLVYAVNLARSCPRYDVLVFCEVNHVLILRTRANTIHEAVMTMKEALNK